MAADIWVLTETKLKKAQTDSIDKSWKFANRGRAISTTSPKKARQKGVTVLLSSRLSAHMTKHECFTMTNEQGSLSPGTGVKITLNFRGKRAIILGMYIPPTSGAATTNNKAIQTAMHRWICNSIIEADTNEEAVLLVGDLNPSTNSPTQAEQAMRQ
ncbi:hypothetical protein FBU31_001495 [Coemansia sp. 'formosensis']|nr:hypothetical protein FBU31_001495 [Coemansia sp. 'formosensis']